MVIRISSYSINPAHSPPYISFLTFDVHFDGNILSAVYASASINLTPFTEMLPRDSVHGPFPMHRMIRRK